MTEILIRRLRDGEADALGQLFHRAVREGAVGAYDEPQRAAWSPTPPSGPDWHARLTAATTVVATAHRVPVGFMTLDGETGQIDLAYVAPEHKGSGVAAMLLGVLERCARRRGLSRLTTDASEIARAFFLKHGWQDGPRQEVHRAGVTLHNYRMEKALPPR